MKKIRDLLVGALLVAPLCSLAMDQKEYLLAITASAKEACSIPPMAGKRSTTEVAAEAKLQASKALKKLVEAGVALEGKYRSESYEGLLAQDLAPSLQNARNCTQNVIQMFLDKFPFKPPIAQRKTLPEKVSLSPGKDTSQDAACGKGGDATGLQVLLGANAFFAPPGETLTVIQMDGMPVVWVKPDANGWHGVFANILRSDGQLLAKLEDSELVPMRKAYGLKIDESRLPHSLRLLGADNKEILVVDYLSEKTMRIRGSLFLKGVPSEIRISAKQINMFGTDDAIFNLAANCFEQPVALDIARINDQLSVTIGGALRFRIPVPEASTSEKPR